MSDGRVLRLACRMRGNPPYCALTKGAYRRGAVEIKGELIYLLSEWERAPMNLGLC